MVSSAEEEEGVAPNRRVLSDAFRSYPVHPQGVRLHADGIFPKLLQLCANELTDASQLHAGPSAKKGNWPSISTWAEQAQHGSSEMRALRRPRARLDHLAAPQALRLGLLELFDSLLNPMLFGFPACS